MDFSANSFSGWHLAATQCFEFAMRLRSLLIRIFTQRLVCNVLDDLTDGLMVAAWDATIMYVIAAPDMLAAGAADAARIGSSISAANSAAAPTTGVITPLVTRCRQRSLRYSTHAQQFQALSARGRRSTPNSCRP
jgi:PE family